MQNNNNKIQDKYKDGTTIIERFCYAPYGTFGILYFKDFKCYTVELPWKSNERYKSCIPEGKYEMIWYDSPSFGHTLAIEGGTVSLHESSHYDRSFILFHGGNWPRNFNGCIGLGEEFRCIQGDIGVSSSNKTVKKFLNLIDKENQNENSLIINQVKGAII